MSSPKQSGGILMYRRVGSSLEVFLVHPGGPFFARKDDGVWTIPKGLPEQDEDLQVAARREFREETGLDPGTDLIDLGQVRQRGGKVVHGWAFEGDVDDGVPIISNTFTMEWPPRSGRHREFPEIDEARFFDAGTARRKINPAQIGFIEALEAFLPPEP